MISEQICAPNGLIYVSVLFSFKKILFHHSSPPFLPHKHTHKHTHTYTLTHKQKFSKNFQKRNVKQTDLEFPCRQYQSIQNDYPTNNMSDNIHNSLIKTF